MATSGCARLAQVVGLGVEQDAARAWRQGELILAVQEAAANTQHQVRFGQGGPAGQPGQRERMAVVEGAAAVRAHHDRALEQFGERAQRLAGVAGHSAAARVDQRPLGAGQQLRRALDECCIGLERLVVLYRIEQADLGGGLQHVGRNLQADGSRPPTAQLTHRFVDQLRHLLRALRARRPLGQRAEDARLVGNLVQEPEPEANGVGRNLASQAQDARRAGVRRRHPGEGIQQARPRHDHAHANAACRARVTVGHVRGGLLVARVPVADALGLGQTRQAVDGVVELDARDAEDVADAFARELSGEGIPAAHVFRGHGCCAAALCFASCVSGLRDRGEQPVFDRADLDLGDVLARHWRVGCPFGGSLIDLQRVVAFEGAHPDELVLGPIDPGTDDVDAEAGAGGHDLFVEQLNPRVEHAAVDGVDADLCDHAPASLCHRRGSLPRADRPPPWPRPW